MIATRTTALRALLLAALGSSVEASARAATPCVGPEVVAEPGLRPQWSRPVRELVPELASAADIERCATVHVRPTVEGADVEVRLPDGRSTTRHLGRPEELAAVVRSLLTNLPVVPALSPDESLRASGPQEQTVKQTQHRELGVAVGASVRMAGRPSYFGYGLTVDSHGVIGHWLFGAWLRWDIEEHAIHQHDQPPDLKMASFLLGPYAGMRFALGTLALDATLGPNLLLENQEAFEGTRDDVGGDFAAFSVGANLRLLAPRSSAWRGFAQLGGDVYPGRVGQEQRHAATLPVLPAFSATLALGAAWSTL